MYLEHGPQWGTVVSAVAALVSIIFAAITIRNTRKKWDAETKKWDVEAYFKLEEKYAETYFKLEEKFYHTDQMRGLRRAAADELLVWVHSAHVNRGRPSLNNFVAFDELGDFFDFIGILVRRGALDKEMAHSSYYRRATTFWHIGKKAGYVQEIRKEVVRWNEFEYLVDVLEKHQECATNNAAQGGRLCEDDMIKLLEKERTLLSIERWAALPSGPNLPLR
jgi:hypothetical protein